MQIPENLCFSRIYRFPHDWKTFKLEEERILQSFDSFHHVFFCSNNELTMSFQPQTCSHVSADYMYVLHQLIATKGQ